MKFEHAKLNAVHPKPERIWGMKMICKGFSEITHKKGRIGIIILPILNNFTLPTLSPIFPMIWKKNKEKNFSRGVK